MVSARQACARPRGQSTVGSAGGAPARHGAAARPSRRDGAPRIRGLTRAIHAQRIGRGGPRDHGTISAATCVTRLVIRSALGREGRQLPHRSVVDAASLATPTRPSPPCHRSCRSSAPLPPCLSVFQSPAHAVFPPPPLPCFLLASRPAAPPRCALTPPPPPPSPCHWLHRLPARPRAHPPTRPSFLPPPSFLLAQPAPARRWQSWHRHLHP